jgi:hypothetical protein
MTMHSITLDPSLRDNEFASCRVRRPEPRVLDFCNFREEPTREDIMVTSLATSLRGMVKQGSISQAEADRRLDDYKLRLQRNPFPADLQVFMSASKAEREAIKAAHSILEYCRARALKLRRSGGEWVCLCPLHEERTPSFSVNAEKQLLSRLRQGRLCDRAARSARGLNN